MNTLETAGEFLAEAKRGIDTGTLTTSEIEDYIASAARVIAQVKTDYKNYKTDLLAQAGTLALARLEHLENVRRLCVYGVAHGRLGREAIQFCKMMETRPPVDIAKGLSGITPAIEWLQARRPQLARLVASIQPADTL